MRLSAGNWGASHEEIARSFPCDPLLSPADAALYRAVTVEASAPHLFSWLCQLRVAPYSYDWLDNAGRRSPQTLDTSLSALEIGQDVMGIFCLVAFRANQHLTLRLKPGTRSAKAYGDVAGTYLVVEETPRRCRLLVKLLVRYPPGPLGAVMRRLLPYGDRIMMRRQLLNLKALAERGQA